jgi:Tfp pilus assembly protein PilO
MSPEKLLGRLNRCFLVLALLAVVLIVLRAFQRQPEEDAATEPHPQMHQQASTDSSQTAALESLKTELDELARERDALREQVAEKDSQNAKLRASLEAKMAESK